MSGSQLGDLELISDFRAGSESAAQELFDRYCGRLLQLARHRLGPRMAGRVDPEDVLQSVYRTFFDRVRSGGFTFQGEDDPFKLLVRLTVRKVLRQVTFHRAKRRDPNLEVGQADARDLIHRVPAGGPSAEDACAWVEELDRLTARLPPLAWRVLALRLQTYSTAEIAERVGTYDRKVRRILEHVLSLARGEADGPA